jgi:hypothetical protein
MREIKMIHKIVYDPVFKTETLFYYCNDAYKVLTHAKKKFNIDMDTESFEGLQGACVGLRHKTTKTSMWLIWISGHKDWKTMVHETSHLVFRILDSRKVKYDSDNDETWCYLHEYFITKFWHIMGMNG